MASELNYDKLVKLVKSDKEITQKAAADALGLTIGQISMMKFCQAQVEAGAYTTAPATEASIKRLRDGEGNRWELIAARTGLSVAAVKDKYPGDPKASYTGKGRNFNGAASGSKPSSRKPSSRKPAAKPSGRKPAAKPSGRKPSGRAAAATGRKPVIRRTTRRSSASNPS